MRVFVHGSEHKWQIGSVKIGVVEERCNIQNCVWICVDLDCFRVRSGMIASSAAV